MPISVTKPSTPSPPRMTTAITGITHGGSFLPR